jgi:hypothetical protein
MSIYQLRKFWYIHIKAYSYTKDEPHNVKARNGVNQVLAGYCYKSDGKMRFTVPRCSLPFIEDGGRLHTIGDGTGLTVVFGPLQQSHMSNEEKVNIIITKLNLSKLSKNARLYPYQKYTGR